MPHQYILLIQNNATTEATPTEWSRFIETASASGFFKGGSAIGERTVLGNRDSARSTEHVAGFMRFDADDRAALLKLLDQHPVVLHGGSVELCELPKS